MNPEGPKNFPGDVRRPSEIHSEDWEEVTPDERGAEVAYRQIFKSLEAQGAPLTSESRVLEIGSGKGRLLSLLQESGVNAVGTDIRPRAETSLPIARARIERLPFADDTFDVVLSEAVFDMGVYEQDQGLMVREIVRVLKPGGLYVGRLERIGVSLPSNLELVSEEGHKWAHAVYRKVG
jgi:SAM-dependent methyltransferase